MILVKNVNGTSRFKPPSGYANWLDYWMRQTNASAICCSACFEMNDLVGAHVQKYNDEDRHIYIVPLCKKCNNRTDTFYVYTVGNISDILVPVPSNLDEEQEEASQEANQSSSVPDIPS